MNRLPAWMISLPVAPLLLLCPFPAAAADFGDCPDIPSCGLAMAGTPIQITVTPPPDIVACCSNQTLSGAAAAAFAGASATATDQDTFAPGAYYTQDEHGNCHLHFPNGTEAVPHSVLPPEWSGTVNFRVPGSYTLTVTFRNGPPVQTGGPPPLAVCTKSTYETAAQPVTVTVTAPTSPYGNDPVLDLPNPVINVPLDAQWISASNNCLHYTRTGGYDAYWGWIQVGSTLRSSNCGLGANEGISVTVDVNVTEEIQASIFEVIQASLSIALQVSTTYSFSNGCPGVACFYAQIAYYQQFIDILGAFTLTQTDVCHGGTIVAPIEIDLRVYTNIFTYGCWYRTAPSLFPTPPALIGGAS